jgi:SAM-dependent methyltransferase
MARLSEHILFWLAKRLYRREIAHSSGEKEAPSAPAKIASYRETQSSRVPAAARRYGVELADKVVLDLACNNRVLTVRYLKQGARRVLGVDIDKVQVARTTDAGPLAEFHISDVADLPLPDGSIDVVISTGFEYMIRPAETLAECNRVLRNGGQMLIGAWGWYHPFAPKLWATMPVPWAHVFFSEAAVLRTCRRVFHAPWYVPNMHDLDEQGQKKRDKYCDEAICEDYFNKFLIRDFERVFSESGLQWRVHLEPFGSRFARWTRVFLRVPYLREFFTAYLWAALQKVAERATAPDYRRGYRFARHEDAVGAPGR